MELKIKRIRTYEELDSIKPIWEEFQNAKNGPSVFQSWTWNRTWCDEVLRFQKHAALDVRVAEESNGKIVAILPTYIDKRTIPGISTLQFLAHRMSIYNDLLLCEPENQELALAVAESLMDSLGPATIVHLRHLGEESTFTKALLLKNWAQIQCPRLLLRNDPSITDQSKRLGQARRKAFRSAHNRLVKEYSIEYRVVKWQDFSPAMSELIQLHLRRFDAKGQSSLLQGQTLPFLQRAMQDSTNRNLFEIVQLRANDTTVAAVLMVKDRKSYVYFQGGFEPDFSRFSPMRLLLTETIRRGFDDLGFEVYDLGDGYGTYKCDWSPTASMNYFCCRGNNPLYANVFAAVTRYAFQRKTLGRLSREVLELTGIQLH
jgi:CelD/BcsL family acetyltransferase involved in cellulose biosynthesis